MTEAGYRNLGSDGRPYEAVDGQKVYFSDFTHFCSPG